MKHLYSFLFSILISFSYAQIINIPDDSFRNALLNQNCVDTNNDGIADSKADTNGNLNLELSELQSIEYLYIENLGIKSLEGISNFKNLKKLYAGDNSLANNNYNTVVDFAGLSNLELVDIRIKDYRFANSENIAPFGVNLSSAAGLKFLYLNYKTELLTLNPATKLIEMAVGSKLLASMDALPHSFSLKKLIIENFFDFSDQGKKFDFSRFYILEEVEIAKQSNETPPEVLYIIGFLPSLKKLHIYPLCNSLDLRQFPNLENIYYNTQNLSNLQLPLIANLKDATFVLNQIYTPFDLSQNTKLINLKLFNLTTTMNLGTNPNLKSLIINGGNQNNLDLSGVQELETLSINEPVYYQGITFDYYNLRNINFGNNSKLKYLYINNKYESPTYEENLTTFNFSKTPSLEYFQVINLNIADLNIGDNENLKTLIYDGGSLQNISLGYVPNLSVFKLTRFGNNFPDKYFTQLDLSGATYSSNSWSNNYDKIKVFGFQEINNVNLKNGVIETKVQFTNSNTPINFCVDKDEMDFAQTWWKDSTPNNSKYSTYCNMNPGGLFNTINGTVKLANGNIDCSAGEPVKNVKIKSSNSSETTTYSNEMGKFTFYTKDVSTTLTPTIPNPYFKIEPASASIMFNGFNNTATQNFCAIPLGNYDDLSVILMPLNAAIPGFESKYELIYKNSGTTTLSGNIQFDYDNKYENFISSDVAPNSQTYGKLVWNFSNLKPFESRKIIITLKLNPPTETNHWNAGDKLTLYAKILPISNDETPKDNNFALHQTVVNSLDPNDKTCLQGDVITADLVGTDLHYLIRFENVGTANAVNIVVKDMIDTSKFDITTLQPVKSSHPYRMTITEGNKVEFYFENIQLPFDDANNDGYILFKIKTLPTIQIGDVMKNTADIYFDYNFPIATNEVSTIVAGVLSTAETKGKQTISVYPNPTKDFLHIKSTEKIKKVEIYDFSGKLVEVKLGIENNKMDVRNLKSGNYILKIFTDNKTDQAKLIKQ